jgi:hypothetical protein
MVAASALRRPSASERTPARSVPSSAPQNSAALNCASCGRDSLSAPRPSGPTAGSTSDTARSSTASAALPKPHSAVMRVVNAPVPTRSSASSYDSGAPASEEEAQGAASSASAEGGSAAAAACAGMARERAGAAGGAARRRRGAPRRRAPPRRPRLRSDEAEQRQGDALAAARTREMRRGVDATSAHGQPIASARLSVTPARRWAPCRRPRACGAASPPPGAPRSSSAQRRNGRTS